MNNSNSDNLFVGLNWALGVSQRMLHLGCPLDPLKLQLLLHEITSKTGLGYRAASNIEPSPLVHECWCMVVRYLQWHVHANEQLTPQAKEDQAILSRQLIADLSSTIEKCNEENARQLVTGPEGHMGKLCLYLDEVTEELEELLQRQKAAQNTSCTLCLAEGEAIETKQGSWVPLFGPVKTAIVDTLDLLTRLRVCAPDVNAENCIKYIDDMAAELMNGRAIEALFLRWHPFVQLLPSLIACPLFTDERVGQLKCLAFSLWEDYVNCTLEAQPGIFNEWRLSRPLLLRNVSRGPELALEFLDELESQENQQTLAAHNIDLEAIGRSIAFNGETWRSTLENWLRQRSVNESDIVSRASSSLDSEIDEAVQWAVDEAIEDAVQTVFDEESFDNYSLI